MFHPYFPRQISGCIQRPWRYLGLVIAAAVLAVLVTQASPAAKVSNYELAQAQAFNRVESYPIQPLPSSPNLRPNGSWVGRLILPSEQEYASAPGDWVWFEVWHSAEGAPDLLGQKIKLTWQPTTDNQAYLASVTRDIAFSPAAEKAMGQGNVLPVRLNGRQQVGPLQSLAGARPRDDVTVRLFQPQTELVMDQGQPVLQTNLEPFQITGREYGLVKILGPDTTVNAPRPPACPGTPPCPPEYFRVQHFNPATQDFSGPLGTLRIPQQPKLDGEHFVSNLRDLENSPAGAAGWYVYGSRDANGMFTVQALQPRALFQLQPDQVVLGTARGLNYIDQQNWQNEPQRQGTLQRVLITPKSPNAETAVGDWKEGDYALVIHLFGGIGGEHKEPTPAGTVTGHFAYGLAQVVKEPLAQELQLHILYQQVYAHNRGGIVAGTHDWSSYMGDLQRGWLGLRPVSDVVVKLDAFTTPFKFGGTTVSLFGDLLNQAQVLAARYRTGDGTGVASVTPATSCVQDSNQALYIAIEQIKQQATQNPDIVAWLQANPDSVEIERIRRFGQLGQELEKMLTPYGVVRPDWQNNAETLAGVAPVGAFTSPTSQLQGTISGILSWRSMMPRWSHDEVSRVFLQNGAQLWFLRTSMVGGQDAQVKPIPPTTLFGLIPGVGRAVQRLTDASVVWPGWRMGLLGLLALGLYALVALPWGFRTHFLKPQNAIENPVNFGLHAIRLFWVPALMTEMIFRVLLLPHPVEGVSGGGWLLWTGVSVGLSVLFPWLLGQVFRRQAQATLCDRTFLLLVGWLSLVLATVYRLTGSLWLIVFIHWIVGVVWIYGLGGHERFPPKRSSRWQQRPHPPH